MSRSSAERKSGLAKDSYNSPVVLNPKSKAVKKRYFNIYKDYITSHYTEMQLAEKYNLSLDHISRIIKWVVFVTDSGDYDTYFKAMDDKITLKLAELERMKDRAEDDAARLHIMGEMRRTMKLQAQLRKILNTEFNIDFVSNRNYNVQTNVNHRSGAKVIEAKPEEVNTE